MTPLPKRGFGPPSYGTFSNPPHMSVLCFFLHKNSRQSRPEALFGGIQKLSGERVLWYVFHPPIRFAPPHITAQFKKNCFGTIYFVKITKRSLYKANSFACSLANRDKSVSAELQRKCSGGIIFVIITKFITKIIVPRNYFVVPPPCKKKKCCRQLFLFVELISSGLPEKSLTWLPEVISGESIPWDHRKDWQGLSAV